jgi:hypothetical protein
MTTIIAQMNKPITTMWQDFETVSDQLVHAEILSDDEIQECLYRASEDEWIQIYKNRFAFANNIRYVIESIDLLRETKPVGKLSFRAMSDDEWAKRNDSEEMQARKEQAEAFMKAWELEQQRIRDDLRTSIDKDINMNTTLVNTIKDKLSQHVTLKSRAYVPRHKKADDPTKARLEKELLQAENELEFLKHKVVTTNFYSLAARKHAFQKEWVSLMQKKAAGITDLQM